MLGFKTTGDGYLISFDRPARAIRCGTAIIGATEALEADLRAGWLTGECEVKADMSAPRVIADTLSRLDRWTARTFPTLLPAASPAKKFLGVALDRHGRHDDLVEEQEGGECRPILPHDEPKWFEHVAPLATEEHSVDNGREW